MTQVNEVMTPEVTLAGPDMPIRDAARLMADGNFGVLPVGENDRLTGVITDRDIACRAVAEGKESGTPVREAMTDAVRWVYEDASTGDAADLMRQHQVRRLPVISREKRLVGIVALGDFAVESSEVRPAAQALSGVSQSA